MVAPLRELLDTLPQVGRLDAICLRREPRGAVERVPSAQVLEGIGLEGDHRGSRKPNPNAKRHVTLIQAEHLPVIASLCGWKEVLPELLRRNLVVSGINLVALKDKQFRIGDSVILEGTGYCHPCSRMESLLGPGGYNATRGHGGITARVIQGGMLELGGAVAVLTP